MEDSTAFDLNNAVRRWREDLSQSPHFREENLAELEAHLRDSVADFQSRGLTDEEAFLLATRRLGSPMGLESEFAKINRSQVCLDRLLWMVVGVQVWGLVVLLSHAAADGAVLGGLAGLGYKFPHSALPWTSHLPTATAFGLANVLALAGCVAGCWWLARRKESTARQVAAKALRRPVLLGLAASVLVLTVSMVGSAEWSLLAQFYGPEALGNIATAQALSRMVLILLQTLGFVVLTIVLLRRRFRVSHVSWLTGG